MGYGRCTNGWGTYTESVSSRKIAGYAGIGQVVVFFGLGLTIFDSPDVTDSADEVREYFTDSADTINVFNYGAPLAFVVFFIVFASGLRSVLGPADSASGEMWARVMFAGAVIQAAVGSVGLIFWGVLAQQGRAPPGIGRAALVPLLCAAPECTNGGRRGRPCDTVSCDAGTGAAASTRVCTARSGAAGRWCAMLVGPIAAGVGGGAGCRRHGAWSSSGCRCSRGEDRFWPGSRPGLPCVSG